ncbi:hypothetical protein [Spiroplasma floricola]|uniref:Uncharacterized protein n=1 Tax=Spiroplasma floricola 23-6 TaxID=1336749 RepID=A0A2K8SG25_9MOLU|nr:hypothetical protein [Spiroplasma floricola]AUB31770.1 hypothetical protein SFLOR_v1c07220 [Spiroplasma floricola 23-6]
MNYIEKSSHYKKYFEEEYKKILIKGDYGSGKTTSLKDYIKDSEVTYKEIWINASLFNPQNDLIKDLIDNYIPSKYSWTWTKSLVFNYIKTSLNMILSIISFITSWFIIDKFNASPWYWLVPISISIATVFLFFFWNGNKSDIKVLINYFCKYDLIIFDDINRIEDKNLKLRIYNLISSALEFVKENNTTKFIFIDSPESEILNIDFEEKYFDLILLKKASKKNIKDIIIKSKILKDNLNNVFIKKIIKIGNFRITNNFVEKFTHFENTFKNMETLKSLFKINDLICIFYLKYVDELFYENIIKSEIEKSKLYNNINFFDLELKEYEEYGPLGNKQKKQVYETKNLPKNIYSDYLFGNLLLEENNFLNLKNNTDIFFDIVENQENYSFLSGLSFNVSDIIKKYYQWKIDIDFDINSDDLREFFKLLLLLKINSSNLYELIKEFFYIPLDENFFSNYSNFEDMKYFIDSIKNKIWFSSYQEKVDLICTWNHIIQNIFSKNYKIKDTTDIKELNNFIIVYFILNKCVENDDEHYVKEFYFLNKNIQFLINTTLIGNNREIIFSLIYRGIIKSEIEVISFLNILIKIISISEIIYLFYDLILNELYKEEDIKTVMNFLKKNYNYIFSGIVIYMNEQYSIKKENDIISKNNIHKIIERKIIKTDIEWKKIEFLINNFYIDYKN